MVAGATCWSQRDGHVDVTVTIDLPVAVCEVLLVLVTLRVAPLVLRMPPAALAV